MAEDQGPTHVVKRGKTPVLTAGDARHLLDSIDTSTVVGFRDRALIGVMVYSFARVGAVINMRVEDYLKIVTELIRKENKLPVRAMVLYNWSAFRILLQAKKRNLVERGRLLAAVGKTHHILLTIPDCIYLRPFQLTKVLEQRTCRDVRVLVFINEKVLQSATDSLPYWFVFKEFASNRDHRVVRYNALFDQVVCVDMSTPSLLMNVDCRENPITRKLRVQPKSRANLKPERRLARFL